MVVVNLQTNTFVNLDSVVFFVLFRVVRMDGVSHISRDEERVNVGLVEGVNINISLGGRENLENSVDGLQEKSAASTLEGFRTAFFMIEKTDDIDVRGIGEFSIDFGLGQSSQSSPRREEVVKTRRRDEFFVKTDNGGGLGIGEA